MSLSVWRITKSKHAETAFTGEGAELAGGRWNSRGTRIVYTSWSISLAILEILAHLQNESHLASYVLFEVKFEEHQIEHLDLEHLPPDWSAYPPSASTQVIGDTWVSEQRSLALKVPSAIVPMEENYLINPRHPDFGHLDIGDPLPLPLDDRLLVRIS